MSSPMMNMMFSLLCCCRNGEDCVTSVSKEKNSIDVPEIRLRCLITYPFSILLIRKHEHCRYLRSITHRNPRRLVPVLISPLPRVPNDVSERYWSVHNSERPR